MGLMKWAATTAATLALALAGCAKTDLQDPGVLAGTWVGPEHHGHRSITFARGAVTSTDAMFRGTFQAEYHPIPEAQPYPVIRVVVFQHDGKPPSDIHYQLIKPGEFIHDGRGLLEFKSKVNEVK